MKYSTAVRVLEEEPAYWLLPEGEARERARRRQRRALDVVHDHLSATVRRLPTDFQPYGDRYRDVAADCSTGCIWFLVLAAMPMDWGVCTNRRSPRCGLLTFEHQGCPEWEGE